MISVGYEARATTGTLDVEAKLLIDAPLVKRDLLCEIVNALKEKRELPQSKELFLDSVNYMLEQFGTQSIDTGRDAPEYDAIEEDSDFVLRLLHETWTHFFPDGCPEKFTFTRHVSLSTDDMIWALGYARIFLTLGQVDPNDPADLDLPDLTAERTLWWVLSAYLEAGETRLDNFDKMDSDICSVCEAVVLKHFGFLDTKHEFGAWGSL